MYRLLITATVWTATAILIFQQDLVANSGALGGIPSVAAPSLGGGSGGSLGRVPGRGSGGFGIQLGGSRPGSLSFGFGGGNISIGGEGGHPGNRNTLNIRDAQRTWQMFEAQQNRFRDQEEMQPWEPLQPTEPEIPPIPLNPIPIQSTQHEIPSNPKPAQARLQTPINHLPAGSLDKPLPAGTHHNPLIVASRLITDEEIDRADAFFQNRLDRLVNNLESKLPTTKFDREQLVGLMVTKKVPPKTQIEIVDALDNGNHDKAQRLWIQALPCCWFPFEPTPARDLIVKIRLAIAQGTISSDVVSALAGSLRYDSVPADIPAQEPCCGADDLVYQLEQEVRIHQVITGMDSNSSIQDRKPNRYGKPGRDLHPTDPSNPDGSNKPDQLLTSLPASTQNDQQTSDRPLQPNTHGKPRQDGQRHSLGQPGQSVPLPTGLVNIVYHPQLPNQSVVVVDSQTVIVGTGGQGVFTMQQGYVAEALGNRVADTPPLPHHPAQLVRDGILIMNPTPAKVHFRIDDIEHGLDPNSQKTFPKGTPGVISFDQGNGKKTLRYTLKPGTYRFSMDQAGLNITRSTFQVLIHHQGNLVPFRYFIQNEQKIIGPESTNHHTDDYPILIRFDRGNGIKQKQVLVDEKKGILQVAINPSDNLWDLYEVPPTDQTMHSVLKKDPKYVPAF